MQTGPSAYPRANPPWSASRVLRLSVLLAGLVAGGLDPAWAQGVSDARPLAGHPVERVTITIANPSADAAFNSRIEDAVRRALGVAPGTTYSAVRIGFAFGTARRNPAICDLSHEALPAGVGGVDVEVTVTLRDAAQPDTGKGFLLTGDPADFPLAYDRGGSYLKFKLDAFALYYANNNAWHGRPDLMLARNPLAQGTTAGRGYDDWVEGYLHYGVFGLTPISESVSLYGGLSAITSGSYGQELFTDRTRSHTFLEDAYIGIVGGNVDDAGNRLTFNLTAGRQRFTLANGFLIANTAANGDERAALQANARWSSDLLVLGRSPTTTPRWRRSTWTPTNCRCWSPAPGSPV